MRNVYVDIYWRLMMAQPAREAEAWRGINWMLTLDSWGDLVREGNEVY